MENLKIDSRYCIDKSSLNIYRNCENKSSKIVHLVKDNKGYLVCHIANKKYQHHQLIAQQWIPNPDNYKYVKHKDGNITNNKIDNLYWSKARKTQK
jgi:hypothetical protein